MPSICKVDNCKNYSFGKGYCKYHQWKRDDIVKKISYIRKETGELELFIQIWNERPHKSFLSGKKLNTFSPSLFAHVLPKAKNRFPKWKLNPDNIILLTIEEHHLYDNGYIEQRERYAKENNCDWNKIYNLYNELKNTYEKEFSIR